MHLRVGWIMGALAIAAVAPASPPTELTRYDSAHYLIHTDLGPEDAREAQLRMARMADEYHRRTYDFSGVIQDKLPVYLFRSEKDYLALGGVAGSAGAFDPRRQVLLVHAGERPTPSTWHVIQHEGFHQFADAVIGELPIWLNEGLAEYFGEAIFTGEGFVSGVVPHWRLQRLQQHLRDRTFMSLPSMLRVDSRQWNRAIELTNYDQAWSIVQFLAHGDDSKHQHAFKQFIGELSQGRTHLRAWMDNLGRPEDLEAQWRSYWLGLDESATDHLYARVVTEALAGALGRAYAQGQRFTRIEELLEAARAGSLRADDRDWMPPSVLSDALYYLQQLQSRGGMVRLEPARANLPVVVCELADRTRHVAGFSLRDGRFHEVIVINEHQP